MKATTNLSVAHVTTTRLHMMAVAAGERGRGAKSLHLGVGDRRANRARLPAKLSRGGIGG